MTQQLQIVEIAKVKRFCQKGKIYVVRKDFGDMLLVSNNGDHYAYFPKINTFFPCDKDCQKSILENGKNLSCLGIKFRKVRKDYDNRTYVVSVKDKNIYFHYEDKNNVVMLETVTIPQFG